MLVRMADWEMREIPSELRERYFAGGNWTDDTLTSHVVRGLGAPPARVPGLVAHAPDAPHDG